MRIRLALTALAALLCLTPAAAAQQPATDVVLKAHETTVVSWNGPAGQSWQVILIGKRGPQALPVTTKRRIAVDYTDVAPAATWGQDLVAHVAPCAAPQETYEATIGTTTGLYAFCTPLAGSWAASASATLQGPPDLTLNNARTRGRTVVWRVDPSRAYAKPSGYTVRWREDACPAASSEAAPCPGRRPWKTQRLRPSATSFAIPGATSDTYWEIEVVAQSDAGRSTPMEIGLYVS